MLDAAGPDTGPRADAEIEADREMLLEETQDIASLLVTADSPEVLRVEPQAQIRKQTTSSLELEVEPAESRRLDEDSFYDQKSPIGAPIGMNRMPIATPARKRRGGLIMGLLVVALIAYVVNTYFSVPTELIESAEIKIAETLEKRKSQIPIPEVEGETEAEAEAEAPKQSSLSPSILDRADELVGDSELNFVPLPEAEAVSDDDPAPTSEVAGIPESDPNHAPEGGISKPSTPEVTTPGTTVAKTAVEPAPKTTQPSKSFSDDLMIINEYTAIPEAASSPPKLPLPVPAEVAPRPATTATTTTPAKIESGVGESPTR
jgi:hypothetical protein